MENQIIIIYPYRFREFDRNRFEVEYLKRYTNVVIHELIDTLHQHFSAAYHEVDRTNDVIRFSTLLGWRKEYLNNMKHFKGKTFVLNFVPVTTFKELFINYILSSSDAFLIKFDVPGVPTYGNIPRGFFLRARSKFLFIINRASFKWFFHTISSRVPRNLNKLLCRKSDYLLAVGKKQSKSSMKVLPANSFDYSMALNKYISNKFENNNQDTIVFLDTGSPLFKTDSFMFGNKVPCTKELWYPSLVNFFNILEKKTLKKVIIAAHPKHKYSKENKHYFGNRKIIHRDTMNLVSQASLVLVTNSTAVSYAVMFNKPVLVLLSNELIKDANVLLEESNYLSSMLGCSTINIDIIDEKLLSNFSINSEKYLAYINKYLSSRLDNKTNGEIIISEILNEESVVNNGMKKTC